MASGMTYLKTLWIQVNDNNSFRTVSIGEDGEDCLQSVFGNGELLVDDAFENIKQRALKYSNYM